MKNIKKDYILQILIIILLVLGGIAIGLSFPKDEDKENNSSNTNINIQEEQDSPSNNEINNEVSEDVNKKEENQNNNVDKEEPINNEVNYSNSDNKVIDNLNSTLTKIKNSGKDESFSKSAKRTFITIVDFLFYEGTINDVKFSELTDAGKSKVLELASKIDNAIEGKIPGYKDTIASGTSKAFNKASELIKKGANNLDNFLQNKLEPEHYESLINAKDELVYYSKNAIDFIGDAGGNLLEGVKEKLDEWYQNWKNK